MVGKSRRCEVCGVRESLRGGFFARFPKDELRCKIWVKQVGKEDLVHVPIEKLHDLRCVCGDHFEKRDFGKTGKRLKKRAYPKLHLLGPPLSDHQMRTFPQHVASKQVMAANSTVVAESLPVRLAPVQPVASTSKEPLSTSVSQNVNVMAANSTVAAESLTVRLASVQPVASASKEPLSTSVSQNVNVMAENSTVAVESLPVRLASVQPVASTSKEPLSTSASQNFNVLATNPPIIPVTSVPLELDPEQPVQPMPSTSRKPLATSAFQNMNEPTPAKRPRLENELLGSSFGPVPKSHKADCNVAKDKLLKQLKGLKSTIRSLKKNAKLMENLESPFLKEIVTLAIKNQKRKPRGHRWTTKYKISCLAILKRSPKAYRYLQHLVPVPTVKTLQNILQKVPMEPGISIPILEHLRKAAVSYNKNDRYCCLLFDEIAIKPRLNYNIRSDHVDGYTDMGNKERSDSLADHALVFMLQGIRKKFKQPLAFYFVKGTVSSQKLAVLVRQIISQVHETGFHVLATVCDQGPTNMGALKILLDSCPSEEGPSVKNVFCVDNKKVYVIYDVPHLFKSIRNNFMNYGELRIGNKTAKWVNLKKVEEKNRNLLYLSKITLNHIEPKYRAKMKVKYAAQALSNTVAAVLKLLALAQEDATERQDLQETGEIVYQLDRLFDFTNGPSGPDDIKKGQRENVSKKTQHLNVWAQYRQILEKMSFNKECGIRAKNVRCIRGYLTTLCSLRDIWVEVERLGFKYLNLRQLNQDALENLFGVLRQHSPTNKNPTVTSFVAALKTAVISGMSAPHSRGSNCNKDPNHLLTDLHDLIFDSGSNHESKNQQNQTVDQNKENEESESVTIHIPEFPDEDECDNDAQHLLSVEGQPIVYVSGYLAMSVLKNHSCHACQQSLTIANPVDDPIYMYVNLREWWMDKSSLTYPNIHLCHYVDKCCVTFEHEILPILHQSNISSQAVTLFMCQSNGEFVQCELHRNNIFYEISLRLAILLIRRQCKRINSRLSAQEENLADKCKKSQQYGIS